MAVKIEGSCLKQNITSFRQRNFMNLFIVFELDTWSRDLKTIIALGRSLFRAKKLSKNADPDKYGYSG